MGLRGISLLGQTGIPWAQVGLGPPLSHRAGPLCAVCRGPGSAPQDCDRLGPPDAAVPAPLGVAGLGTLRRRNTGRSSSCRRVSALCPGDGDGDLDVGTRNPAGCMGRVMVSARVGFSSAYQAAVRKVRGSAATEPSCPDWLLQAIDIQSAWHGERVLSLWSLTQSAFHVANPPGQQQHD